jgi:hypothetical protein
VPEAVARSLFAWSTRELSVDIKLVSESIACPLFGMTMADAPT